MGSAGDVDGDGLDDVIVGAPFNAAGGTDAGAAHVVLGSTIAGQDEIDLAAADYTFTGEEAEDYAGHAVSGAGDVDGDGLDDFLIGAPRLDGTDGFDGHGAAYLVLGDSLGSATTDLSDADYIFTPDASWAHTGAAVAAAGDVDGDGLADVLIGSKKGEDNNQGGQTHIFLGKKLSTTTDLALSSASHIITPHQRIPKGAD